MLPKSETGKVNQPHPRLIRLAREVGALPAEQPSAPPVEAPPVEAPPAVNKRLKIWSLLTGGRRFAR